MASKVLVDMADMAGSDGSRDLLIQIQAIMDGNGEFQPFFILRFGIIELNQPLESGCLGCRIFV